MVYNTIYCITMYIQVNGKSLPIANGVYMKKLLTKILLAVLTLSMLVSGLTACTGSKWTGTTLKTWGNVKTDSLGGFVAETDNYLYFINGSGVYTEDNTFGVPVKGALCAVEKSNLGTENQKVEIVVPKLFVATDFNSGLYIFGDYVYYATPNTSKNASGNVANTILTFTKTKLDGTETQTFFEIDGLDTEYRIIKNGNDVLIVYVDDTDTDAVKLVCYNTTDNTSKTIISSSVSEDESLGVFKFVDSKNANDVAVVYTTTVYTEEYDENDTDRSKADYNKVYAYKAGSEPKLVLDGGYVLGTQTQKPVKETYTLDFVKNGFVFYTVSDGIDLTDDVKYGVKVTDLFALNASTKIINNDYADEKTLIVALDEVYVLSENKVKKTTLNSDTLLTEKTVAVSKTETMSKLLFKEGDYVYYFDTANKIARMNIDVDNLSLTDKDFEEQRVSAGKVSTGWYLPELVKTTVGGIEKTLLFYCDETTDGASYLGYVDVNAQVKEEVEDEEVVGYYLDSTKLLSIMSDADVAKVFDQKVELLVTDSKKIELDTDLTGGEKTFSEYKTLRDVFDGLTKTQQNLVSEQSLADLNMFKKTIEVANQMKGLVDFDKATSDAQRDGFRSAYDSAKNALLGLSEAEADDVKELLPENYNWYFQTAKNYFEEQ